MAEPRRDFTPEEYRQRIERIRSVMAEKGLDLLVISDPSNMHYVTGYDGWSFYTHQAALLAMEGDPVWWGRGIDALGAKRTSHTSERCASMRVATTRNRTCGGGGGARVSVSQRGAGVGAGAPRSAEHMPLNLW